MARILVVDDDSSIRTALDALLTHHGHSVALAADGAEGIRSYAACRPDVVIMDLTMPGLSGVETLTRIRETDPLVTAVFLTAFGSIRSAVEAIRVGGFDYLTKPFDNDELMVTVDRALSFQQLHSKVARLEADLDGRSSFSAIVGRAPSLLEAVRTLTKVARLDTTVLLLGESGTGKELAAQNLHRQSQRASGPFVALNCSAIPPTLAEAELFGHERGAFTDAKDSRPGRFEQADGGTLFLDEVGELTLDIQAKLLRVLQEREIWRVGGRRAVPVNVRVIAATNRNLTEAIAKGGFRDDLFWRLNAFPVTLPPLRDRPGDIPLLIDHLMDRLNVRLNLRVEGVSDEARKCLSAHDWPGNVRELENVLQRAMILTEHSIIQVADLPQLSKPLHDERSALAPVSAGTLDEIVTRSSERIERTLIENALNQSRGNRSKASALLGINRRTLFNKLKKLRMVDDDEDAD